MEQLFGEGWKIYPAGGTTGEAFLAVNAEEKLFLKRNSSPFLAILSAEGIVPKLLWTKRVSSGDVLTAQQWMEGRKLQPNEMQSETVALLLNKIHTSKPLLSMLKKINKGSLNPQEVYRKSYEVWKQSQPNEWLSKAISFMGTHLEEMDKHPKVVCHGDLNHHNFITSEVNNLYLVDWDQIKIADRGYDLAYILTHYVPVHQWEKWLNIYGVKHNEKWQRRIMWYSFFLLFEAVERRIRQGQKGDLALEIPQFKLILEMLKDEVS